MREVATITAIATARAALANRCAGVSAWEGVSPWDGDVRGRRPAAARVDDQSATLLVGITAKIAKKKRFSTGTKKSSTMLLGRSIAPDER